MFVDKYIAWAHINNKKIKFKGSIQCNGSMEKQTKFKRFRWLLEDNLWEKFLKKDHTTAKLRKKTDILLSYKNLDIY